MPANLTSTGLIADIRRNAALGPPSTTFPTDADLLAWLNEEMTNRIVTLLMRPREEFFVRDYDFTTTGDAEYRIPASSTWSDVRDVQSTGIGGGTQYVSLPRIMPEMAPLWSPNGQQGQGPAAYYLRDNYVVLVPTSSGALCRIKYFRRPGYIVTASSYSIVTGLTGSAPTYTATVASTTGLTSVVEFEFASKLAPFDTVLTGVIGVVANGTTLTLTLTAAQAALITANLNDCYALAAGDAPGPQIPQELCSLLEQSTTYRALVGKGDAAGAKAQLTSVLMAQKANVDAMFQRANGLGQRVVGTTFSRRGGFRGSGWGGGGVS